MSSPGSGADVVAELARRFQAGDGAGAFGLFHPDIRIELFSFRDGLVAEIRVFQQDTHLLLATLDPA